MTEEYKSTFHFITSIYSSYEKDAKYNLVEEGRNGVNIHEERRDIVFMTEEFISRAHLIKTSLQYEAQFGIWFVEPYDVHRKHYHDLLTRHKLFDFIITHDIKFARVLKMYGCDGSKIHVVPYGNTWIPPNVRDFFHTRTKLISTVSSAKQFTSGHKTRMDMIKMIRGKFRNDVDVFGRGWGENSGIREVACKGDAITPYKFTICIENSRRDGYFSEKLIDALVCHTVPIYVGTPNIGDYFNVNGMILANDIDELEKVIRDILDDGDELYDNMVREGYIADNYNRALEYVSVEPHIRKVLNDVAHK